MHIAVIIRERCNSKKCGKECQSYCPQVRMGIEAVVFKNDKPEIIENLCEGCGICVHKCPFEAVKVIRLPEELNTELIHQYGENGFRLYRVPTPQEGKVIGILGPNGIGKSTVINILSGLTIPNLGNFASKPSLESVIEYFSGTSMEKYFQKLSDGDLKSSLKPQYVDKLVKVHKGKIKTLLKKVDETGKMDEIVEKLGLNNILSRDISLLSGGELQTVAIAATLLKDADVYFFDEPSSYLDIYQRLKISKIIRELSSTKALFVIEHDLAVLDFLADEVHLMYGSDGAYGIISQVRSVKNAINTYLSGYMREENIRFRDWNITFTSHVPRKNMDMPTLIEWQKIGKKHKTFEVNLDSGNINMSEVVGIVGPNAIGKTTFIKMLAGVEKPTTGEVEENVTMSYKPQYIKFEIDCNVETLLYMELEERMDDNFFKVEVLHPLQMKHLMQRNVNELSGGELQKLAIVLCLGKNAELYLIDEPSAYLDSNQRMVVAKTIKRVMSKSKRSAVIVDHDVYFLDLVSDSLSVFSGIPGKKGKGEGPFDMRVGLEGR